MLPVWQKVVEPFVSSGELAVVGVVPEQHPDRAKLYRQWKQIDWPILVDSLNLLGVTAVPIPVAIDSSGIVRHESIWPNRFAAEFMEKEYPPTPVPEGFNRAPILNAQRLKRLRQRAESADTAAAWRAFGDACFLLRYGAVDSDDNGGVDCSAVQVYRRAVQGDEDDGPAQFRLGVALRARYESRHREDGDAQAAVEQWGRALAISPNQYIWRRRIQQYGPRLDKPYNFYFWVEEARREIRARGAEPVELAVEPMGSEVAPPTGGQGRGRRTGAQDEAGGVDGGVARVPGVCEKDASRIDRDTIDFVSIEPVVTPARVRPGQRVRVRLTLRLNETTRPYWNNEAEDVAVCVDPPAALSLGEGSLAYPNPEEPETREVRVIEFEMALDDQAGGGTIPVPAHALYYVCGNKGGKCRYLRQDFAVNLTVDPEAPLMR